jgi:hypothetical protein
MIVPQQNIEKMSNKMKTIIFFLILFVFCSCENKNSEMIDEYFFDDVSTGSKKELKIGDLYHGGKIAYLFQPADNGYIAGEVHGIIACITDLPTTYKWYNGTNIQTNASYTGIGFADENSKIIQDKQGAGNYAASMCLSFATGTYLDWFLPTIDELMILYNNRDAIGGFSSSSSYWSSSETANNGAYGVNFSSGLKVQYFKDGNGRVRPISYF